jgi:hypothetical protein
MSLNYYVGPFAASKNNQQGQKGHEQGVRVESLTMGQFSHYISDFD